jgi:hypothetical protein
MTPENDQQRTLREEAAALATEVSGLSEQLGDVSRGLSSLQKYGHRNRMLIIVTIISIVIELSLMAALAIVTSKVINNNHRSNANFSTLNCFTKAIAEVLPERSAFYSISSSTCTISPRLTRSRSRHFPSSTRTAKRWLELASH